MTGVEARAQPVFDRRLDPASSAPVALALSGGGDSMALLLLAAAWCAGHGRPLLALTVDHRLHPDSAAWTDFAARAAASAGALWRGLAWDGPKPSTGVPAAARAERHRLLAEAAREAGARVLLTGHTRDDASEGELMRLAEAPTLGVLSEWSPSPAWPAGRGLFLLRPLLGIGRTELRHWLDGQGWAWIDDPANLDRRYARVRARQALGDASPAPSARAAPTPDPSAWSVSPDGRVVCRREAFRAAGARRLLSAALLCAAGTDRPPRGERLARLLERLAGEEPFTATLAGARVEAQGRTVGIGRDAGERFRGGLQPVALPAGAPVVWDGRFEVRADAPGWRVEALGGAMGRLAAEERRGLRRLPAWSRGGLPALVAADGAVRLPRPFGAGPAQASSLAGDRLAAACGLMAREADIGESRHGAAASATLC